jgi:regulator of nucleoside diphosphate kinase
MNNIQINRDVAGKPNIIVSSLDLDRIETLIDSLPESQFMASSALLDELGRADVVEPAQMPPTVVTMNSKVKFVFESSNEEFCYTLVYPKDLDGQPDKISILAPVGSALLGLSVGDHIEWPGPKGDTIKVQLKEILYQPERAGEYYR